MDLTNLLKPPRRMTVSQSAEEFIYLNNPGSYVGPYSVELTPYMKEPMNTLTSRKHDGVIFVGPAQTGKTESLCLGLAAHSICTDPMDMIIYNPSQTMARDFSMRRVDKMHNYSPEIGKVLLGNRDSDNVFDKHYRNGMILTLSWPTVAEFSGRPVGRVIITDYDRIPDNVGGEGNAFDLASKRTTTFGSFACAAAESSPSRVIENTKWIKKSPHEAPPCSGILGLYNRGDRRRFYWPCPFCDGYFEGTWRDLTWDKKATNLESARTVKLICPLCKEPVSPFYRKGMLEWGVWLREGQYVDKASGEIRGVGVEARLASFWMNGIAAAYTTWEKLVENYLNAMQSFEKYQSEEELKKFYNTDLGEPYIPKNADTDRIPEELKARAEPLPVMELELSERIERLTADHSLVQPMVPPGVRCLLACVDVQANCFVVQVHGILPGEPYDIVVVDRFKIKKSRRLDHEGESLWVNPGTYLDDWEEIITEVMERVYFLSDDSGRRMAIRYTVCDSGGHSKTTTNAYAFYRSLKERGKAGRFHLLKGDPLPSRPRTQITFPDSNQRDKLSAARGDVPVMLLNSNVLKDSVVSRLECVQPGKGMFRFPDWLPDWWYGEMCAETRTDKGWMAGSHKRNEGWDLSYYCVALCASKLLLIERMDWNNPPGWLKPWDKNDLVIAKETVSNVPFAIPAEMSYDFSKFGKSLAGGDHA